MTPPTPPHPPSPWHTPVLLAVLALGAVLPTVWWTVFPSVDLWNHLAVHQAQRAAVTGEGVFAGDYVLRWSPYPYSGGYLVVALARAWFAPLTAGGVILAWCHLGIFLGAWVLLRSLRLPLAVLPLAAAACFGMPTWYGFVPYLCALGPALAALGALLRVQQEPNARTYVWAVLGVTVTYVMHLEAWAVMGFLAGVVALVHPDRWRRLARVAAASVPSLVLVVMWLQGQTGGGERTLTFSYGAPKERFGMWQLRNLWEEGGVFGAVPAVVVALALVAWLRLVQQRRKEGVWSTPHASTLVALGLGGALLHLGLPKAVEGGAMAAWGESLRVGPVLTVVAMTLWTALPPRVARAGVWLVAVLCLGMDARAWGFARSLDAQVEPLLARLAQTTPGTRGLVLTQQDADRVDGSSLHYLEHVSSLWVLHGAVTNQFFRVPGTLLVHQRPHTQPPTPEDFLQQDACTWSPRLDQVILQGRLPREMELLEQAGFVKDWETGRWSHWHNSGTAVPCPPR